MTLFLRALSVVCACALVPLGAAHAQDADGDGFSPPADCDDADPAVNPAAIEVCDAVDNDCDGLLNEGCSDLFLTVAPGIAGQQNTWSVYSDVPSITVHVAYGQPGQTQVPGCPGVLEIANPKLFTTIEVQANGVGAFTRNVPADAAAVTPRFQAIHLPSCDLTPPVDVTF